jgi:hypothetical protein
LVKAWTGWALAGALTMALATAPAAFGDGTETLGPPSVPVTTGTGSAVAGVGTYGVTSGSFTVNVPSNAIVKQVLLYWEGHATLFADHLCNGSLDPAVTVNGNPVTGTKIGGETNFFQAEHFASFRQDITSLNLVKPGANTLTVSDMNFGSCFPYPNGVNGNDGAGVAVIYDNGGPSKFIALRDGEDLAFAGFASPLDTTVPQTFTFASSGVSRSGTLGVLAGSVAGPDLAGLRGNIIAGAFNTGQTFSIVDGLQSNQGHELDAANFPITVPAGATSLTVQAISQGGAQAASFSWIAGALSIEEPPTPPAGSEGCTPGYWKNHTESWGSTGYSPSQALSTVFSSTGLGTLASTTMLQALQGGGGPSITDKKKILLRAAVASLLNAAHPGVDFSMTTAQIITAVNAALESNDPVTILNLATDLDRRNNGGCALN